MIHTFRVCHRARRKHGRVWRESRVVLLSPATVASRDIPLHLITAARTEQLQRRDGLERSLSPEEPKLCSKSRTYLASSGVDAP
jgi:hypothetical protein